MEPIAMPDSSTTKHSNQESEEVQSSAVLDQGDVSQESLSFLRRVYQSNRDWYLVSENKTQLLIGADGVFVSIFLGVTFGANGSTSDLTRNFGPETWAFALLSFAAVVSSIILGTASMWSYHRTGRMRRWAKRKPGPSTLRAHEIDVEQLWYFGHIATLDKDAVAERLKTVNASEEANMIARHLHDLSVKVYMKFRLVNAGWALTAASLVSLSGAAVSLLIRSGL